MENYKKHLLQTFSFLLLFCGYGELDAQCNCLQDEYYDSCNDEIILSYANGTNITDDLYDAIHNACRIRLSNTGSGTTTYYTYPQVFRNIDHKEIILDAGVYLLGIPGGFSDCSQSVLTFDGNDVHDILIRGDYCEGEIRPRIGMTQTTYFSPGSQGYLVGADSSGDPYLNNLGQPNYVFSDGDSDPYFDNTGNPNFITNSSQLKVSQSCDYNDYLCNRKIIVWCPYSWEARHIIAFHGVENVWINDIEIVNASGGDGIHITDDRDFNTSSEVHLANVDFIENARNGLKITNASCVDLNALDFRENGTLAPLTYVTPEAALNIDQNTAPGSIDDFMGTPPNYAMYGITLLNGYFYDNTNRDLSFDFPINQSLCSGQVGFKANSVCIFESDDAVVFEQSNFNQSGLIRLDNISIDEYANNAVVATSGWLSSLTSLYFMNWSVNKSGGSTTAYSLSSPTFCSSASISDICKSTNIVDNLCVPAVCSTPSYFCLPNQDPECKQGENCETVIYPIVQEELDYDCDCDYFFMVDESSSVNEDEWDQMHCSITSMMSEVDSICDETCATRFGLMQWSSDTMQNLVSNLVCSPFNFQRTFDDNTDVGAALDTLLSYLDNGIITPNNDCFKILIFTDAPCSWSGWGDAEDQSDDIKVLFPNVEFYIVDYSGNLHLCNNANDVVASPDGTPNPDHIIDSPFDCETGVGIENIADTTYTYSIHAEIDPNCVDPTITWTAYDGGVIISTSPDGATVEVNGLGYYTVQIICESGCEEIVFETIQFEGTGNSSRVGAQPEIVRTDRTRYHRGIAYTPQEYELLKLKLKKTAKQKDIQISPNPFNDILNIQLSDLRANYELTILNTKGQVVLRSNLLAQGKTTIDLSHLTDGLYMISLLNNHTNTNSTYRVVKLTK